MLTRRDCVGLYVCDKLRFCNSRQSVVDTQSRFRMSQLSKTEFG